MALFADESSPLLPRPTSTPLPKAQLFTLCLIRLVEPIAFAQVFPYINEMIADLHLPGGPSRTAFYSGLAESAFAISSLFSIYHWARLSGYSLSLLHFTPASSLFFLKDVIGRRPVIFIGMLGMNLATLLFGLQRTLVGLLLVRCLGQSLVMDSYRLQTMLYHSRRFLLRQRGRYLFSPGRTHRFHEPSYRLSYFQSCLASWYYHRVGQ
jgi:MFS family permease